eukprot:TRINITY_DN32858_c0_g1_i1.p1 TRINITY_DN32858_c0_g1~~TRINITY_DN32858_c0_g1_i1.p1  ORF type:complete len:546 (-),score=107.46 TRINITY_DN32858_c0_g1_i1:56-1693(-)
MTSARDLILLGWTVFVALHLLSLWAGTGPVDNGSWSGGGQFLTGLAASGQASMYRGRYRLRLNSSQVREGPLHLIMGARETGVRGLGVTSFGMDLIEDDSEKYHSLLSSQVALFFSGLAMNDKDVNTITATGTSDPSRLRLFGPRACRLSAVIELGENIEGRERKEKAEAKQAEVADGTAGFLGASFLGSRPNQDASKKEASSTTPLDSIGSLSGEVVTLDCGFQLFFSVTAIDSEALTEKVAGYSLLASLLCLAQIRLFFAQMVHTEESGMGAEKVSVVSLSIQVLMDAYDSFLHLCVGLSTGYFNTILMVCLFKFLLFSVVQTRYFLTIWRQRNREVLSEGMDAVRRELTKVYSRFSGLLVLGLAAIYYYIHYLDVIVVVFQAYWLPQIALDAWQGTRNGLQPKFIIGTSITRVLLILYLWACPKAIFDGELLPRLPGAPSSTLCTTVVLMHLVQVSTMMLQRHLGPRFLIPWACMPQVYNYRRPVELEPGAECVICMSELDPEDTRKCVTPCSHVFHSACLEQWLDVKMECPTCRASLPSIE